MAVRHNRTPLLNGATGVTISKSREAEKVGLSNCQIGVSMVFPTKKLFYFWFFMYSE
jgi:hypothetical protein